MARRPLLHLLLLPLVAAAALPPLVDVFSRGGDGYFCFRIPALLALPNTTLLLFAEGRKLSCADSGFVDLVMKSSHDGGVTWGPLVLVRSESNATTHVTIGNPAPVALGGASVLLPFCRNNQQAATLLSTDGGASWTMHSVLPTPPTWSWVATGPAGSLLLPSGRILVPADHNINNTKVDGHSWYSDDGGVTWGMSNFVPSGDESQAVALPWVGPNAVLLSSRTSGTHRIAAQSLDGGASWGAPWPTLNEVPCEASTLALPAHPGGPRVIISSAYSTTNRSNMTLVSSTDEGHTWAVVGVVYPGDSAYSSLVELGPSAVGLAFERQSYGFMSFLGPVEV